MATSIAITDFLQLFFSGMATGRIYELAALGIDLPRMIFYTFAINAVLACAAALLVTPTYLAKFDMDRCTHCADAERRGVRITELAVAGTRRPCETDRLTITLI